MLAFFTASQNVFFAVALGLLLVFLVVEVSGLLFGVSVSNMVGDGGIGDIDPGYISADGGSHLGFVTSFLYWLNIGRAPLIILFVLLLAFFVVVGYTLQYVLLRTVGHMLPFWLATPAALLLAIPPVRWSGRVFAKIAPGTKPRRSA